MKPTVFNPLLSRILGHRTSRPEATNDVRSDESTVGSENGTGDAPAGPSRPSWIARLAKLRIGILGVIALLSAAPALVRAQTTGSWQDAVQRLRGTSPAVSARAPRAGAIRLHKRAVAPSPAPTRFRSAIRVAAAILPESEPNDDASTADRVALGDQATGVIDPQGDADLWFIDLSAGDFLSLDVDAEATGSALDPVLFLLAPDGHTVLSSNDDFDGLDSRISFRIPASGRYYAMVRAFGGGGRPDFGYALNVGTVTCSQVGTEHEPNDSPATASPFSLADTVSGEICPSDLNPAGDVDYWAFSAQAGTALELDVDAEALGVFSDPFLRVFDTDGITELAANDDADGSDSRLQLSFATTGTYYAAVSTLSGAGGNPFPYRLRAKAILPGPGDPTTVLAGSVGQPLGLVAGRTGDFFVGDVTGNRVLRVSPQGQVTSFVTGIPVPTGLAFDVTGQLLVVSFSDAVVYRVTPQGQATRFITDANSPFWIAVAPDGRIWLSDQGDRSLRRYSPGGRFEARFDALGIGGSGPGPLAIGPSGQPFVSNGTEIWRLEGSGFQRVLGSPFIIWAFAFDVGGNIYAPNPTVGGIRLFDAAGHLTSDPFAVEPSAPFSVAFGRDATGATDRRLFATDGRIRSLIALNPAGVQLPGLPVGVPALAFDLEAAAAGLLGGGGLTSADQQLLDALGNQNGRYDLGDFQAFLRSVGGLPGAAGLSVQPRQGNDR